MRALAVFAWIYVAALALFAILLLAIGESWWAGTMALYLPRLPLLAPLVLLLPLARDRKRRVVLAVQATIAIAIVLVVSGPHVSFARAGSGPRMRVFSYNVWFSWRGVDAIDREVAAANADVMVFQAMRRPVAERLRERFGPSFSYHGDDEFFIASRYPITNVGDQVRFRDAYRQYTLDTPLGTIDVLNIHPFSPRSAINELRAEPRRMLKGGTSDEAVGEVEANTDRRQEQIVAISAAAGAATHPLVIAGDSNLPEHSALFRYYLGRWQDGFASAGTGFGYTFPANRLLPWMRIDRILAGPELRFTSFTVGGRGGSDHCPVWADLEKR